MPDRRKRLLGMIAALALAAMSLPILALGPAQAGSKGKAQDCGDLVKVGAGVYNVRGEAVKCPKARKVAGTFYKTRAPQVGVWTCSSRQLGSELFKGKCLRASPSSRIFFAYGS